MYLSACSLRYICTLKYRIENTSAYRSQLFYDTNLFLLTLANCSDCLSRRISTSTRFHANPSLLSVAYSSICVCYMHMCVGKFKVFKVMSIFINFFFFRFSRIVRLSLNVQRFRIAIK